MPNNYAGKIKWGKNMPLNPIKILTFLLFLFSLLALHAQTEERTNDDLSLPRNDIELSLTYLNAPFLYNDAFIPSTSLSYYYRLKKWFWLGVATQFNYVTPWGNKEPPKENYCYFGIAPAVRFSYINKPQFTLYSGLAIGPGALLKERELTRSSTLYFQVTHIGFSYGRNLYIGGEMGAGLKGFLNLNIGYRF